MSRVRILPGVPQTVQQFVVKSVEYTSCKIATPNSNITSLNRTIILFHTFYLNKVHTMKPGETANISLKTQPEKIRDKTVSATYTVNLCIMLVTWQYPHTQYFLFSTRNDTKPRNLTHLHRSRKLYNTVGCG